MPPLEHLDRARRGYLKRHDVAGLEHLIVLADVLGAADERARNGRENLVYAIEQNVRTETRRTALQRGERWQDPYPDLQAPTEHTGIDAHARGQDRDRDRHGSRHGRAGRDLHRAAVLRREHDEVTLRLVNDSSAGSRSAAATT